MEHVAAIRMNSISMWGMFVPVEIVMCLYVGVGVGEDSDFVRYVVA